MSEPNEADRARAQAVVDPWFFEGGGRLALVATVAAALAAEREESRANDVEAIRTAWNDQCAGNKNADACESCRAYSDALSATEATR